MRSLLVTLMLGLAGGAFLVLTAAADMVQAIPPHVLQEMRSRAAKLRVSAGSDPETVWVGHVNTNTGLPGTAGGYGPYHIGRGANRIVGGGKFGTASDLNGVWDFDHFNAGETDSLQGWWPIQCPYGSIGPTDFDDNLRPWFCLDYGNFGCYYPTGPSQKTFGVTGYWHADGGSAQAAVPQATESNPLTPSWAPIAGTRSAWCGLRSAGDGAVVDQITGNAYNSDVVNRNTPISAKQIAPQRLAQGTDFNYPGYGGQWDQMLYRDVFFAANASGSVTLSFKYATNMDTRYDGGHASQAGWFDKDPLKTAVVADGNFYSVNAAPVVDSFMVYVGAPVNESAVTFSDGSVGTVFDPQRRWFSEVVKINTPGTTYKELLSTGGVNGSTAAPITFSTSLSQATVNAILDADGGASNGGRLRVVFRVKTNRGFDDETNGYTGFSSGTAGAAIIDDVSVSGGGATALTNGFESAGDINNSNAVAASAAWKSTGKPPGVWFHLHDIKAPGANLPFEDPCGSVDAAVRFCNMYGNVLSPGNHDLSDKTGGEFGSNTQDQQKYICSPTINLKSNGSGDYNGMGIDAEIAARVPQLWGDQLLNIYNYPITGNGFRYCWQSYPATQPNGVKTWGTANKTIFFNYQTFPGCFVSQIGVPKDDQLVHTTNANGIPDSIRVYIESMARCFAVPSLTNITCSPSSGAFAGGYYDNLSLAFITAPPPAALATSIWDLWNDAFPTNSQLKPTTAFGVAYDTLAANIRSAYNTAPQMPGTNITGPSARENIPGDSMVVQGVGDNVRMDLVFRILPGVGNYVQIGNRASGIARRPDTVPRVAATTGDPGNGALTAVDKFWGTYMADNGAYGTGGNGVTGPGHPGGVWDPNRWNSARLDTLELNFFPINGVLANSGSLTPGIYMSTYHEADPKYTVLGIAKNRCFYGKQQNNPYQLNLQCGNLGGGISYPPSKAPADYTNPASGFNPNEIAGQTGKTYEYTKIVPDGQLTPGALIQYFFRKSTVGNAVAFEMAPDTNFIFPQTAEGGYFDYHRWRTTAVLPDRWKDAGFGGNGMATMIVFDFASRRGDVGTFVAMADSIGLTAANRRGAANGWRARPDQDFVGVNVGSDDTICRRDNPGQTGSLFDLYQVIAGESNVPAGRAGSRAANHNTQGGSFTTGKWSTNGPSADMANNYRIMVGLASDSGPELLGPIANQTDDDIGLFTNFMLSTSTGSPAPRGFIIAGEQLGEGFQNDHPTFPAQYLRSSLRTGDYRSISGNGNNTADLIVQPPVSGASPYTYGIFSQCFLNNDVFTPQVAAPAGQAGAYYENVGAQGPYVGAVYSPDTGTKPYKSMYMGWTVGLFGGMGTQGTLLNVGTRKFFWDMLTYAFSGMVSLGATPVDVGDGATSGSAFVNFMNLKSSNPMHSGQARIAFGIQKTDKVQVRIYDVTGRLVKTIADRTFVGGQEHVVIWDGSSDAGQKVKSGVYFYQLKTSTWTSQKKLAVLSN